MSSTDSAARIRPMTRVMTFDAGLAQRPGNLGRCAEDQDHRQGDDRPAGQQQSKLGGRLGLLCQG